MTRRTTVIHLHGVGRGGRRRGRHLRGGPAARLHGRRAPDLAGTHTLDSFSALVADQPGYRLWGLESAALDLALRQAGTLARRQRSAASRSPSVRRLPERGPASWRELYPEIRFKLDASDKWTDEVVAELAATGRRRRRRLEGPVRGRVGRRDAVGGALRPRRRSLPGRLARGRAHQRRDARRARAAPRPAHLGLPDPLRRGRRRARVAAALPQLEAVALRQRPEALRLLRPCAASAGSRSTAAASSSSGPAAARSSTSPRSSTRTCRTTSRRRSTTTAARGRACRRARSRPRPPSPGSGDLQARPITSRGAREAGRTRARSRRRSRGRRRTLARRARSASHRRWSRRPAKKSKAVHRFRQQQQRKG